MKTIYFNGICLTGAIIFFIANLSVGKISIPIGEILEVFTGKAENEMIFNLVVHFRLIKIITAVLIGITLPVSGFLLQELFRNPLAGPSVLGITSTAGLGVATVIFLFSALGLEHLFTNSWLIILAAFSGALLALIIISLFTARIQSSASIIIIGMMLSGFASAFVEIMQLFSASDKIKTFLIWGFGSLSSSSWEQILVFSLCTVLGLMLCLFSLRGLTGLQLGENYAKSLGINVKSTRLLILFSTAILSAAATAFAGPIAFVGLAVPYLCKQIIPQANKLKLLSGVISLGVCLMLFFALLTDIFPFGTLPINIITSLFGAPVVVSIILKYNQSDEK